MATGALGGPVSGPPVAGPWTRTELGLVVDHATGGRWTSLRAGEREWLAEPAQEVFGRADDDEGTGTRAWQPSAEAADRLGQPSGSPAWRVVDEVGSLARTLNTLSGAVRIGYRTVTREPWRHEVRVPLSAAAGSLEAVTDDRGLVGPSGWAHAWVLDGPDALGLHWTTDQREDLGLLRLRTGTGATEQLVAPSIGSPEQPVPPRRDLSWRLVLTAWRR
ncbi:hypothetical protein [Auraticoccus monumenti]|uniref:Uncharacterized protein n=1 Tax=Auraticoccus monumenti TaxID=675864 RepID=A0A1G7E1V0_9ACTN|nr:hypothetical protein [Auraticoccus monumenti]SDE57480.1 hypothetical protein SAMN04489747_3789 [Auraticoccus monumenti]